MLSESSQSGQLSGQSSVKSMSQIPHPTWDLINEQCLDKPIPKCDESIHESKFIIALTNPKLWWISPWSLPIVRVCIRSCLQNETVSVSDWARFGPKVLSSPGRKVSLVDPAWQRDTSETHEINQTVSEIVSVSSKESNFNQENNSLVLC